MRFVRLHYLGLWARPHQQPQFSRENMMSTRKIAALAAAVTATLTLAACGGGGAGSSGDESAGGDAATDGGRVGIAMPTQSSERWIADGTNLKEQLEALGYDVDLQYAEDDIPAQVNQIDNMITQGADVLIIASIDGTALTSQLEAAADAGISVIAYDRLIMESPDVDFYTTFDSVEIGRQQARSLLQGLGLVDAEGAQADAAGPFNVELFAGSPDDSNSIHYFDGALEVLQPLIDDGTLVVKSGQTDFKTVATLRWDPATAQARMENLLTSTYSDGSRVDAVLSPYDGLSIGILGALKGVGYGTSDEPYPIVSGQDAEVGSVKSIIAGEQFATIFVDTRELAKATVNLTDSLLKGEEAEVNDTESYDNGVMIVPAFKLPSTIVTKENYQQVLVDSGYYEESDLS